MDGTHYVQDRNHRHTDTQTHRHTDTHTMSHLARLQEILNYPPTASDIPTGLTDNEDYYDDDDEDDSDYCSQTDEDDDEYQLSAQEHWEESINQIKLLVNQIMFPLIGKVLGRRFSHVIWKQIANWWFI